MKNQTKTNLILSATFACTLALSLSGTVMAADEPAAPVQNGEHQMMGGKSMSEKGMMDQKKKMMAAMKAQDSELIAEVAKMNSAPEDKKLDLVAAVVTRMVEQRTAMNAQMARMNDEMMQRMEMDKESMAQRPMMKGMKGMDEKSPNAHMEHQAE